MVKERSISGITFKVISLKEAGPHAVPAGSVSCRKIAVIGPADEWQISSVSKTFLRQSLLPFRNSGIDRIRTTAAIAFQCIEGVAGSENLLHVLFD